MGGIKYKQPHNLKKYYPDADTDTLGRIHNGIKRNGDGDFWSKYLGFLDRIYLRPMKKSGNKHNTRLSRIP